MTKQEQANRALCKSQEVARYMQRTEYLADGSVGVYFTSERGITVALVRQVCPIEINGVRIRRFLRGREV